MKKTTINKLNQLNKDFYRQTANSFSRSRSYYWSGWEKLVPYINLLTARKNQIDVLDVGCGNGRFGIFLAENSSKTKINYFGIDYNRQLLSSAEDKLSSAGIDFQLKKADITQGLGLTESKFDLTAAFGLFHHLPSYQLRRKILKEMAGLLCPEGLLVTAFWQFGDKPRFKKKIVDPKKVGINPEELDDNDYILDWKRGKNAYRYCHHFSRQEIEKLVKSLEIKIIDQYLADGKTGNLNSYLICKNNDTIVSLS
jgi:tRNA (uracil-5-)-methyltransferase TRM9